MKRNPQTLEEAKARMMEYLKKNPITKEQLALWADAEEKAKCGKGGRVIYCGDLDKMCGDPECGLKKERQNASE